MLNSFIDYLTAEGKSINTIKNYKGYINKYLKWYHESFGEECTKLYRTNILEFKAYLINVKQLNNKTINGILSALIKLNEHLVDTKVQDEIVITKKDMTKIQTQVANPTNITKKDVEAFRQLLLQKDSIRNYAIVTILSYAGLRISECLNLKLNDLGIKDGKVKGVEIRVQDGKGGKQRDIPMSAKIVNAVDEYLKVRKQDDTDYLFVSKKGGRIDKSVINRVFNKYTDITPHQLRHFFCTNALENEFNVHEVANMAGHSNIHTTLIYTNPNKQKMLEKINRL